MSGALSLNDSAAVMPVPPPVLLPPVAAPAPAPAQGFSKVLHDTVYGLQKDVVKIMLLTCTTLAYTAIKEHAASIGLEPRAFYRGGRLLLSAIAIASLTATGPIPWTHPADLLHSVVAHPLKAGALALLVLLLDYAGVTKLLLMQAARFRRVVSPALRRLFIIGQPTGAAKARAGGSHAGQQALLVAATAATTIWQWLRVQEARARVAAAQLDLQRLLEARRRPRSLGELGRVLSASEALVVKVFRIISALFGTGSAIKYLFFGR